MVCEKAAVGCAECRPDTLKRHCKAKACIHMPGSLKEAGGDPRSRDTKDPRSHAVLQRRFPSALRHPLAGAARTVTLEQLLAVASAWLPRRKLDEALEELRRV